jgi:hypothetical protein
MNENMDQTGITDHPNPLNQYPPIWQELVIELFFRPRKFFADMTILMKTKYVVPVTWIFGLSQAIDKIDEEMIKVSINPTSKRSEIITSFIDTWINYWGFILAYGTVSALFLWWVGGWWYRKRLEWSGAVDPDHRLARVVYIYASFVFAAPAVIFALIQTSMYDNYIQSYNSGDVWPLIILVFLFWSLGTSYIGVRTTFTVSRWKARTWFIILPTLLYLLIFGGMTVLLAL